MKRTGGNTFVTHQNTKSAMEQQNPVYQNFFTQHNGHGMPTRTFRDTMTLGSGSDAFAIFPALHEYGAFIRDFTTAVRAAKNSGKTVDQFVMELEARQHDVGAKRQVLACPFRSQSFDFS